MFKSFFYLLRFLLLIIGLFFYCINGENGNNESQNANNAFTLHANQKLVSPYTIIKLENKSTEFIFEESNFEDDFEISGFTLFYTQKKYSSTFSKNKSKKVTASFCVIHHKTPLYDLFCNWKHHLS